MGNAESVLAEALARLAKGEVPSPQATAVPSAPRVDGYEEAASVLGWFDPGTLQPSGSGTRLELDALLAEATTVIDDQGARQLSIGSRRRVKVLRYLRDHHLVSRALAANRAAAGDVLHQLLRDFATAVPVDLERRSLAELHSIAMVCDWLREAGFQGLPTSADLQSRIDQLAQLEPLELLVTGHFVGRRAELGRIREFVGSASDNRRTRRGSSGGHRDVRMLVLYGPAGIGKSTVLARFLVDLARGEPSDRIPFAYLDFDRPTVDSSHPLRVLIEAVTQIAVQVPRAKARCERIVEEWAAVLEQSHVSRTYSISSAARDLGTLVRSSELDGRPLLLVLDTFEVVQYRSSEEVTAILKTLDQLVAELPGLRVIVAGRAGIQRPYADQLEIAGLDPASAAELLKRLGVTERTIAERIAKRYNRDPQALKLAAADPDAHRLLPYRVSQLAAWFQRLDSDVIQRKLYERVLGHVHDARVRALANPGLVIRRLTPEIVLRVLAEPCGLEVTTLADAASLCAELRREVSLVAIEPDGALVHRPELRRTMLPLVETDRPVVARALHRAAVAYYADRLPEPRERAEEIYHRLKCGESVESVDSRWLDGAQPFLADALDEFDGANRAFLAARLGLALDGPTTHAARLEDWERLTERKVRAMLDDDRPRDALTVLGTRKGRSTTSPLVALAAEALFRDGQVEQAIVSLGAAADAAWLGGHADHASRLTRLQAECLVSAGAWDQAEAVDARLEQLESRTADPALALACSSFRAVIAQRVDPGSAVELQGRALRRFDALADSVLILDPGLVRLTGSLMGGDPVRLIRAVRLAGLPRQEEGPVRVVAAEVASLDVAASKRHGELAGMLARRHHVTGAPSLTAAWSAFLLNAGDSTVRTVLSKLLEDGGSQVAPLTRAVARALGADPALRRPTELHAGPEPDVVVEVALAPDARQMLSEALVAHFTPDSLRWFVRLRLHHSLSALVPNDQTDFHQTVERLVASLEAKGLLLELVARCREVAPGDRRLLHAAKAVGLLTPLSDDLDVIERRITDAGFDLQPWLDRLGQLEGQVCQVHQKDHGKGTGFLVGADLLLTSTELLDGARLRDLTCRFDVKRSRDGRLVTPGVSYQVRELVAAQAGLPDDGVAGWALLRVAGSPGVQPIGGDAVESETGMLRGWVDVTRRSPAEGPGIVLVLGAPPRGSLELSAGRTEDLCGHASSGWFEHDVPASSSFAGAPIFSGDLTLVGLQLGAPHPDRPEVGTAISLSAVRDDLRQRGIWYLLDTSLA